MLILFKLVIRVMKMSNKAVSFIKKNYHWIILSVFVILLLVLHRFVILQGDDYYHSFVTDGTVNDFFEWHKEHYMTANGRALVHFILTLFLYKDNFEVWKIFGPLFTGLVLVIASKAFTKNNKDFKVMLSSLCILFLSLGGKFSSLGLYTLTPAFNYLYPMALVFLVALLTYDYYDNDRHHIVLLPLTAFFAGATMEQTGIMSIGYIILISVQNYITQKKKPCRSVIVALFTAIIGYLTVMLAPGNFVRMGTSTRPFTENFVAASTMLINTKSFVLFNLILIASFAYWLLKIKFKNKLFNAFNLLLSVFLLCGYVLNVFLLYNNIGITFDSNPIIHLAWELYDLGYIFAAVYVPIIIWIMKKDTNYLIHMIIALGSIFILLFASVSEYRPLIPAVLTFCIFISLTVTEALKNKRKSVRAAIAVGCIASVLFWAFNLYGYYSNYSVYIENEKIIQEYKADSQTNKVLHLKGYSDEETAGYTVNVPGTVFDGKKSDGYSYEVGYMMHYGLDKSTVIYFD